MPDTVTQKIKPLLPPNAAATTGGVVFPVVALGASAGGLEACVKFLDSLPVGTGMAFILVQRSDPTNRSVLVELLAEHTHLTVVQAVDGMPVEREHLYVIPPGALVSVRGGKLLLSPSEMHGGPPRRARLPFDRLLQALANEYGARAICVVLSGSGTDGSAGLRAVKAAGGRVVVQDPAEADYDGMPRSAIATGDVDAVSPAAGIPAVLAVSGAAISTHPVASPVQPVAQRPGTHAPTLSPIAQAPDHHAPTGDAPSGAVARQDKPRPEVPDAVGQGEGRFPMVQKAAQPYRHVRPKQPGDLSFGSALRGPDRLRLARPENALAFSRTAALAELCGQTVLDLHAPATVLCDARYECLYLLGPIDRYLQVPPGQATANLLAMARGTLRTRLRGALIQAAQTGARVTVPGGRMVRDGHQVPFSVDVQPVDHDGEALLLVCLVDAPVQARDQQTGRADDVSAGASPQAAPRIAELEAGNRGPEASAEAKRAGVEKAPLVNEEYQSTNEELLAANEELTALNSRLQATLDSQRTTSDDLQNILCSNDVATLLLDRDLGIRFFTPATRALFNVILGDIGRPLADLHCLATDTLLPADARTVLRDLQPVEREVETPGGVWFRRRILPYRTGSGPGRVPAGNVEGVVITFNDITRRKQEAAALEEAKQEAEVANLAKSRFLAEASHDLRQPLHTMALLQGLLARAVAGTAGDSRASGLVQRLEKSLDAMSGMLDTLLDLDQIETGVVRAELVNVPAAGLLNRLRGEFTELARAKGLTLRVMPCSATIRTDPRMLEQMLRNLISHALKYTRTGRVLVGCRHHGDAPGDILGSAGQGGTLSFEVWDTGIGTPAGELQAVFDEYHPVGDDARGRSRGLGLSIVQRLSKILGHPVRARSRPGRGSAIMVEVPRVYVPVPVAFRAQYPHPGHHPDIGNGAVATSPSASGHGHGHSECKAGSILVVEECPDLRNLLRHMLQANGHNVTSVPDGPAAIEAVQHGGRPSLVIADYNLPGGMNGLQAVALLRQAIRGRSGGVATSPAPTAGTATADMVAVDALPAIILTRESSAATLHSIADQGCFHLSKPVMPHDLAAAIHGCLTSPRADAPAASSAVPENAPLIFLVDDDQEIRTAMRGALEDGGYLLEDYADGEAFLAAYGAGRPDRDACLLVDAVMPGIDGLEVLRRLTGAGHQLPAIVITGHGDVHMAVQAMKAGALDFIEKPVRLPDLLEGIDRALHQSRNAGARLAWQAAAAASIAGLTTRQRDILTMVLAGQPSKNIAADLGISQRTVENHRAAIMHKTGTRSLPALARLALAAEGSAPT